MLILGLLLVVVSGAAAAVLIAYNTGGTAQTVTAFGRDVADVTMMQAFLAGIVVALVFLLGLSMVMMAGRRGRENRARYREARREAKAAAAERDELAEQLRKDEEERSRQPIADRTGDHIGDHIGDRSADRTPAPVQPAAQQPVARAADTTQPVPAPADAQARPADPNAFQQPVITNIKPGQSPTR